MYSIVPNCAEGAICNDRRSLLYTAGGWGCCLAGPGQSAGGGEAPGSSEKFAFYSIKRGQNTFVWCIFSVS